MEVSQIFNNTLKEALSASSREDILKLIDTTCEALKISYIKVLNNGCLIYEKGNPLDHVITRQLGIFTIHCSYIEINRPVTYSVIGVLVTSLHFMTEKEQFLAQISHELRTPLNAIIGASFNLSKKIPQTEELKIINNQSHQLLEKITNISTYKKEKEYEIHATDFNVDELVYESYTDFFSPDITFNYKRKTDEVVIHSDFSILNKILHSIFDNALKFNNKSPVIDVSVESFDNKMKISISDNGIGIEKKFLSQIFSGFAQEQKGDKRNFNGCGLNLCLAKQMINQIKGTISITSEGKDKGTSVTIIFPYKKIELSRFFGHLLLVDDEEINQEVTKKYLTNLGFDVDLASNGKIGLELFKANPLRYNAIIMDCQMPEMDGYECTQEIRKMNTSIPIIGFSANALRSNFDRCIYVGMNTLLLKPINDKQFKESFIELLPMCYNNMVAISMESMANTMSQEFLDNLIEKFIDRLITEDFKHIEESLTNENHGDLTKRFHKLKSTFGSFGFIKTQELLKIYQEKEFFKYEDYFLFRSHVKSDIHSLMDWLKSHSLKTWDLQSKVG